ncbi:universal stress protein family protein [Sinobacterium caligoides]|uniref:Universal stress protein family protein n=1 Tax=Sinobacterium caligoides TaxID=933926 RepID=A0A3N2DG60_9GAMM|nr:universal stress protein [Sinobacterium caligoides]ROR98777.1 universal stress protein family protein [Sinobacterium caligoides]
MSSPKTILACIDGSKSSTSVCDYAAWISRSIDTPVQLLHTCNNEQPAASNLSGSIGLGARESLLMELANLEQQRAKLILENGKQMLAEAQQRCRQLGINATILQRHGGLAETLVDLEDSTRVLVLGLRGEAHQDSEAGIGHKLESALRTLHRPMLVVNQDFVEPKNVMLAFDGSSGAEKALEMVCASPLFKDSCCHVIFVGSGADGEEHLRRAHAQLTEAGHQVKSALLQGKLDEAIGHYQAEYDIDMTVMGAFSHSRIRDILLGSLTSKVLHNTAIPLLLLR